MIQPTNNHILIEPLKYDGFITTQKTTYQEIGVVLDVASGCHTEYSIGDKVFFDAWLGKKYPKEGTNDEFYWLIKDTDVVAYEKSVSK